MTPEGIVKWHKEYRRLKQIMGDCTEGHGEFDYGYPPLWYVTEELNCKGGK